MLGGGVPGDEEPVGDLAIGRPLDQQAQDLAFPGRQCDPWRQIGQEGRGFVNRRCE